MTAPIATALDAAMKYAGHYGWPVFPCNWRPGPDHKKPLAPRSDRCSNRATKHVCRS